MHRLWRYLLPVAVAVSALAATVRADLRVDDSSAESVVRLAIAKRLGRADAVITITDIDVPSRSIAEFRDAVPEPGARLGRPMRFLLRPVKGRPVLAIVTATVVADQTVAERDIAKGAVITSADLTVRRGVVTGATLRRMPTLAELQGARARRALSAGLTLGPVDVAVRRAVEPGDKVTVVATSGAVEVSATFVAADGGDPGDVVRVVNPDTRRDLRARVTDRGRVEVNYGR